MIEKSAVMVPRLKRARASNWCEVDSHRADLHDVEITGVAVPFHPKGVTRLDLQREDGSNMRICIENKDAEVLVETLLESYPEAAGRIVASFALLHAAKIAPEREYLPEEALEIFAGMCETPDWARELYEGADNE